MRAVKQYVSADERATSKAKNGNPVRTLEPTEQRHRAKVLRYQRQTGEVID